MTLVGTSSAAIERCFIASIYLYVISQTKHRSLLSSLAEDFLFVGLDPDLLSLARLMTQEWGTPFEKLGVVVEVIDTVIAQLFQLFLVLRI